MSLFIVNSGQVLMEQPDSSIAIHLLPKMVVRWFQVVIMCLNLIGELLVTET